MTITEVRAHLPAADHPTAPDVVRAQQCPWCSAAPWLPCVALGSGRAIRDPKTGKTIGRGDPRPLRLSAAHPARYAAAGLDGGSITVDTDTILARRSAAGLGVPHPKEEG